jgi:outer membrane protein assembly factor BamB
LGVHHHDAAYSGITVDGPYLYLNSGNGVDRRHSGIPSPDAPSLIVLDKRTGRLVAYDNERIGPRIYHCTWSAPSLGVVNARKLVFFGGGDGVCYAFKALEHSRPVESPPQPLELVWRFDCDPAAPKEHVHQYIRGDREASPSNIWSAPVILDNRLYVTVGGDYFWGKRKAWLKCIDATQMGDITETGQIWSSDLARHCTTTPAVHQGLVYVGDQGPTFRCIDAATGEVHWTHRPRGEVWSSPLCVDGKVYFSSWLRGRGGGDLYVFEAAREKKLLARIDLGSRTYSAPVAASGVLYITTMNTLYAVSKHIDSK